MSNYTNPGNYIDVAVMNQLLDHVTIRNVTQHIIYLDKIPIASNLFQTIFYGTGNKFALNPSNKSNSTILPYISLKGTDRTISGEKFSLVNIIYDNLEKDLNVTRDMFEPSSTIALNYTLSNLLTLYDISNGVPIVALDWSNILNIVQEVYNNSISGSNTPPPTIDVNLVISVIFTTPTVDTNPTVIKFIYQTTFQMS